MQQTAPLVSLIMISKTPRDPTCEIGSNLNPQKMVADHSGVWRLGVFKTIRIRKSDLKYPISESEISEKSDIRNFGYLKFEYPNFSDSDSDSDFQNCRIFRISEISENLIFIFFGYPNIRKYLKYPKISEKYPKISERYLKIPEKYSKTYIWISKTIQNIRFRI
ncbi:hypothetical protein HanPI659440_Chr15g0605301 [Helianthus annuus]|nr:hypothetical protein HanPI659440_Chr15g0605301 [Helianthus annuus]